MGFREKGLPEKFAKLLKNVCQGMNLFGTVASYKTAVRQAIGCSFTKNKLLHKKMIFLPTHKIARLYF